ncbi:hypothetical protein C8Q78DRAFT_1095822 [Trametes maxima]|nr:hypothetical protein C8Q78DRAFT_1095822 [Trametes maxima]
MSFTLDDSDPSLAYSVDGWAVQPPGDPQLGEFFQRTYHATQQDGATLKFQFSGSAFAIYGSKGPGHALYRVQADNVVVNLDASAPQTEFQQELVTHTFDQSGVHTVILTALLSGVGLKGKWLDVDYITFTTTNCRPNIATVTSTPPWFSDSSQTNSGASPTGLVPFNSPSSPSTSSPKPSNIPTILAILFGALIALGLALLALYLVLHRISTRRRARERAFRYGQSSANPAGSGSVAGSAAHAYAYAHSLGASAKEAAQAYAFNAGGGAGGGGIGGATGGVPVGAGGAGAGGAPSQRSAGYYSTGHASLGSNVVEMRAVSTELLRENAASPAASSGIGAGGSAGTGGGRPTVSSSPIAWTRQKVGGGHRGDADSLRTDFLQV